MNDPYRIYCTKHIYLSIKDHITWLVNFVHDTFGMTLFFLHKFGDFCYKFNDCLKTNLAKIEKYNKSF